MAKDRKKLIVLVVEDNDGDYFLVEDFLQDMILSPQIHRAISFKEARSFLSESKNQVHAILLDLSLPDKTGELLIKEILAISKGLPLIILTGFAGEGFAIKSLALGASDYLLKDDLNATILYKSIIYSIERAKNQVSLKESELRYAELFHLSPQPMWVYDIHTLRFIQVNKAACDHYGYTSEEFLSMTIRDIRPLEEVPLLEKTVLRRDVLLPYKGVFRHIKKNGEVITVEIKSDILTHNGNNVRLVLVNDISEKKKAQEELLTIAHQVEDRERTRISIDLHDGLQQTLVTSYMHFESIKSALNLLNPETSERFTKGMKVLNEGIEQVRTIAHELMPPKIEKEGYVAAITQLLNQIEGSIQFKFVQNLGGKPLPPNISLILFRISQEAINNIIKHSKASRATMALEMEGNIVRLSVVDNGKGFSIDHLADDHSIFGLRAIGSRIHSLGGVFELHSEIGRGTSLTIEIPIY